MSLSKNRLPVRSILAATLMAAGLAAPPAVAQDLSVMEPIIVGAIRDAAAPVVAASVEDASVPALPVVYSDEAPEKAAAEDAAPAQSAVADLSHTVEAN